MSSKILEDVKCDKTNGYTVKEILSEHIKEQHEFNQFVRERFESGTGKISRNWAWIRALMVATGFLYTFILVKAFI